MSDSETEIIDKYKINSSNTILDEVLSGLNKNQKQISCKFFYDKKGSELFEKICELPEYYLTRTELEIIKSNINDITSFIGDDCLLVELGSGNSLKIRLLLDNLNKLAAYIPLDISYDHLIVSTEALCKDYPGLRVIPVCADYTKPFDFPELAFPWSKIVIFYPGSTIGNFSPEYARRFLNMIAKRAGKGSGLLIGVDLKKDNIILENAYNDSKGVTAEFNLNVLSRLNNEIGSDFDISSWEHKAFYNENEGRIEMHLVSLIDQLVSVNGAKVHFKQSESVLTEYSYKYAPTEFGDIVKDFYKVEKVWIDKNQKFSLQYLSVL